jgi:hypothetical protein
MTLAEFMKFSKNSKIFPDLLTMLELKKILAKISPKLLFVYNQFEAVIKELAANSFTEAISLPDKIRIFFMHIRNP